MDFNVWGCGYNAYGQIGIGLCYTSNCKNFTKIRDMKAKKVYCGSNYSLLIDVDENVWVVGNNCDGQIGLEYGLNYYNLEKLDNIKAHNIACGKNHTIIMLDS